MFCFPYAGSSSIVTYKFLVDALPELIDICLIELPGRGIRINEKLINNLNQVVGEILKEINEFLDIPFIFFGHSMGALISYVLANEIHEKYKKSPYKLYISSHKAPFQKRNYKKFHKMENSEFKSELLRMNGIPQEVFENDELMEILLPIIKNDFEICETYEFKQKNKLNTSITVLGGNKDEDVTKEDLISWKQLTCADFEIKMFEGDHFYFIKNSEEFTKRFIHMINHDIMKIFANNNEKKI